MTTLVTRAVAIDSRVSLPSLSPARNRARRRSRGPIALRASGTSDGPPPVVRVAVLCGGPTLERGISLNSARSILDHLRAPGVDVECYYLDQGLRAFPISVRQMYSNTPSDFDFKLRGADADADADAFSDPRALAAHLRARGVIAFPALHGAFGEDGVLQGILEDAGVPVVGTAAAAARRAFDKRECALALARLHHPTLPSTLLESHESDDTRTARVLEWFTSQGLDDGEGLAVVKPARGGSSVGVVVARGAARASGAAKDLFDAGLDDRVVVERHAGAGREFTVIVLETRDGPLPLIPTEVVVVPSGEDEDRDGDAGAGGGDARIGGGGEGIGGGGEGIGGGAPKEQGAVFDFRRKYLPTMQVEYHTPARFGDDAVRRVRERAAETFSGLGLRDFVRLDGFFMPRGDVGVEWRGNSAISDAEGEPVFTDVNIISGMEQTSFLFLQAAEVGLSHSGVLRHALASARRRVDASLPSPPKRERRTRANARMDDGEVNGESTSSGSGVEDGAASSRRRVYVLFGGGTSERQVSLVSGVNVWLKLRARPEFEAVPLLLAATPEGESLENTPVWRLPYACVLRHTVEEVVAAATTPRDAATRALVDEIRESLRLHGWAEEMDDCDAGLGAPRSETLASIAATAAAEGAVVFNVVHGGCGEDGSLQTLLASAGAAFTGSRAAASRLCIDKAATGAALAPLASDGILSCRKRVVPAEELAEIFASDDPVAASRRAWDAWALDVGDAREGLCVKPNSDGCSTGVARLRGPADLLAYADAIVTGRERMRARDLPLSRGDGGGWIELPRPAPERFLVEPFVSTLAARVRRDESGREDLVFDGEEVQDDGTKRRKRLIEVTVAVVGERGRLTALDPSLTIVSGGDVLSLEEKFQGGTGVNITPPPPSLVPTETLATAKRRIARAADALGVEGFARVDAFLDVDEGEVTIIEVNTVPGMTPSTVLFHQALAMDPPMEPADFLAHAVCLALDRRDE